MRKFAIVVLTALSILCLVGYGCGVTIETNLYVKATKTVFEVGEEFTYDDLIVEFEEDGVKRQLTSDEYTVDYSLVNVNAEGEYEVKVIYERGNDKFETTYKITYVSATVKREVKKPLEDTTVYTYDGTEKTYLIEQSDDYVVTNSTHIDAGTYVVTVTLNDPLKTKWEDGSVKDLNYTFIINKATPVITVDNTPLNCWCNHIELPVATSDFGQVIEVWDKEDHLTAGRYIVTFTVEESQNWNKAEAELKVNVNHKESETYTIDKYATAQEEGLKHTSCVYCGAKMTEVKIPNKYIEKANNLRYFIKNYTNTANYNWYFNYGEKAFEITVDIEDDEIVSPKAGETDDRLIGMSDNVEIILQAKTTATSIISGESFDVLVNPLTLTGWAKYAANTTSWGDSIFDSLIQNGKLVLSSQARTLGEDGYDGVTLKIFVDYDLIGGKNVGNMTVACSSRNTGAGEDFSNSHWRFHVDLGERWMRTMTFAQIHEDGSYGMIDFNYPNLDEVVLSKNLHGDDTLFDNMAVVNTTCAVRKYGDGALLFDDREYFVEKAFMLDGFENLGYIIGSINGNYNFEIAKAGYLVVALPSTGFANTAKYFTDKGFVLVAGNMPHLGNSAGSNIGINETTDYYVKWCEESEKFTMPRWGVVFTGTDGEFEQDVWTKVGATVYSMKDPEVYAKFKNSTRSWQGIPGIEAVDMGNGKTRLFASWFSGGTREPHKDNYAIYAYSDDGGQTWSQTFIVSHKDEESRVFDPSIFNDKNGNVWLIWNQGRDKFTNTHTLWYAKITNPTDKDGNFNVTQPIKIADTFLLNKPTITSEGNICFVSHSFADRNHVTFYESTDKGETWKLKGTIYSPAYIFVAEASVVDTVIDGKTVYICTQRCDQSYNCAVSYSYDKGETWTDMKEFFIGPSSRSRLYRLSSGNIAFVYHYNTYGREKLCIRLSTDGGKTFNHALILDVRNGVSYPNITELNGKIYVAWDYNRYNQKQVLMTTLTESELLQINGVATMDESRIVDISTINPVAANLKGSVSGYVYDKNGNKVVGAKVSLGEFTAVTDENGYYRFENLVTANYVITVNAENFVVYENEIALEDFVDSEKRNVLFDMTLQEQTIATINGTVKDVFGDNLGEVSVDINGKTVTADKNGAYSLECPLDNFAITLSKAGYVSKVLYVNATQFTEDNAYTVELNDELLMEKTLDLGLIGGTYSDMDKTDGHVYRVYLQRTNDAMILYVKDVDGAELVNGYTFEYYTHVYNFITTRTENTIGTVVTTDGGITKAMNFKNNTLATISTDGVVNEKINGKYIKTTLPYSYLGQFAPSFYEVDKDTIIGFTMLARNSSYSGVSQYINNDYLGASKTNIVVRGNSKDYLLIDGNAKMLQSMQETKITKEVFNTLAGVDVFGNFAQLESTSQVKTIESGTAIFSDRAASIHGFDGWRINAINGLKYFYDGVKENTTVTAKTAGYIIVIDVAKTSNIPETYKQVIIGAANLGIATSKLNDYYVVYLNEGDTFTTVGTGDMLIVFGD